MTVLPSERVMVVEDNYYLAKEVRDTLQGANYTVIGPFANVRNALGSLERDLPDCAVLDVRLGEETSFEVAGELRRRGIPFLFFTGYDAKTLPAEFADMARLEKPVTAADLLRALEKCCRAELREG